jgi:hypothetical protein
MTNQTGRNLLVAFGLETTFGTPPAAGIGKRFRLNGGGGLNLGMAVINPGEIRSDGMTSMGRYGSRSVTGGYPADISIGTFDDLIQAALRGTWVAAVTLTQATGTSVTATAGPPGTIVRASGSWITDGVRVGDVVKLNATGGPAGNNNRNLRVVGVTALTLTVAETLTVDATPRTTYTLTIAKKVTMPSVPVRRSFTFEEYENDVDLTGQFVGCRISSMHIVGQPDGMATIEFGIVGSNLLPLATGASPFFTSPTLTTSIGLTMVDASIRYAGADIVSLTSFDLTYDLRAAGQPVIGSTTTPDVFDNPATISGSISGIRQDFTNITRALAETELELQVMLVEPESEPKDFLSIWLPRIKITVPTKSYGNDGALIETMPFMVGPKEGTTGYDTTMIGFSTSAP